MDHPKTKRGPGVLRNSALNILGQFAIGATGALCALLNARALGPELLGVLGVTFVLADFGRPLSSFTHIPSIMQVHAGRNPDAVFATSVIIKLALSTVFSALILALSPLLMATFRLPPATVLMASAVVLVGSFYEVGTARLEAENRMARSNVILAGGSLVGLAALAAFWLTGALTVYTSIASVLFANAAMSIGSIVFVRWPLRARFDRALASVMLRYGVRILATALLAQALLQAETLLVSRFLDNHEAGVYTVIFSLAYVMVTASQAVGVAVLPEMSRLASRGEDTAPTYHRGTLVALGVGGAISMGLVILGRPILALYGPSYAEGYIPLVILTGFGLFATLTVPATAMLNVHGHAGTQMRISLVLMLLNLGLSVVLIRRFGLAGGAAATTGVFLLGMVAGWITVRRHTGALPFGRGALRKRPEPLRSRRAAASAEASRRDDG